MTYFVKNSWKSVSIYQLLHTSWYPQLRLRLYLHRFAVYDLSIVNLTVSFRQIWFSNQNLSRTHTLLISIVRIYLEKKLSIYSSKLFCAFFKLWSFHGSNKNWKLDLFHWWDITSDRVKRWRKIVHNYDCHYAWRLCRIIHFEENSHLYGSSVLLSLMNTHDVRNFTSDEYTYIKFVVVS